MKTIYAFDKITGRYLGGFNEKNPLIPNGSAITDYAPDSADQIFKNGVWVPNEIKTKKTKTHQEVSENKPIVSTVVNQFNNSSK